MESSDKHEGHQGFFGGLTRLICTGSELLSAHTEQARRYIRREVAQLIAAVAFYLAIVLLMAIGAVLLFYGLATVLDQALGRGGLGSIIVGGAVALVSFIVLFARARRDQSETSGQKPSGPETL